MSKSMVLIIAIIGIWLFMTVKKSKTTDGGISTGTGGTHTGSSGNTHGGYGVSF